MPGPFIWFDLSTRDGMSARGFYERLLDWEIGEPAEGAPAAMIGGAEGPWGSISESGNGSSRWMPYVQVEDVDAAAAKAVDLGAKVLREKTRGPAGWFATIEDPTGAALALWQPAAS